MRISSFMGGQSTCYRARVRKKLCSKGGSFLDLKDLEGENLASSLEEGEETSLFLLSPWAVVRIIQGMRPEQLSGPG